MKKLLVVGVIGLFLGMSLFSSAEESTFNGDDLDVKISAGFLERDIGRYIRVKVVNNRNESIIYSINTTVNHVFTNLLDYNRSEIRYIAGKDNQIYWDGFPIFSTVFYSISVEGGNTKVMRKAFSLFNFVIFYKS